LTRKEQEVEMGGNTAYLLENQSDAHFSSIFKTVQNWTEQDPDVHLISNQGAVLPTHRVFLKLYSAVLNSALQDFSSDSIPSILIPASTASLVNLIKIMSSGVSISDQKDDLLNVVTTAELMGIFLKDLQIGAKGVPILDQLQEEIPEVNVKKKNKRTKKKSMPKNSFDNVEIKTEKLDDDSVVNQDQGTSNESVPDTDVSQSLEMDSSAECTDDEIGLDNSESKDAENDSGLSKAASCYECLKTFANKDKLKRHFVIHTGEKAYPCLECDSKFTRKDKLSHHWNVKHNEEYVKIGHECYVCNKAHGSKWHLNRHMQRTHSFEVMIQE